MYKIGITGGIGCGKSTLLTWLKQHHIEYIDADLVAREVVVKGSETLNKLSDIFGKKIINVDGTLNRKKLADIVFNDKKSLNKLNNIMHADICENMKIKTDKARQKGVKVLFYDVPLLIEINLHKLMDEVWVVWADEETCISRIMKRDNLKREEAINRIKSQMPISEKKKYANVLLNNSGTKEAFYKELERLWNEKKKIFTEV